MEPEEEGGSTTPAAAATEGTRGKKCLSHRPVPMRGSGWGCGAFLCAIKSENIQNNHLPLEDLSTLCKNARDCPVW